METYLQKSLIVDSIRHLNHSEVDQVLKYIKSLPDTDHSVSSGKTRNRQEGLHQIRLALAGHGSRRFSF